MRLVMSLKKMECLAVQELSRCLLRLSSALPLISFSVCLVQLSSVLLVRHAFSLVQCFIPVILFHCRAE